MPVLALFSSLFDILWGRKYVTLSCIKMCFIYDDALLKWDYIYRQNANSKYKNNRIIYIKTSLSPAFTMITSTAMVKHGVQSWEFFTIGLSVFALDLTGVSWVWATE